jgi:diguanylate cyclase
MKFFNRRPAAEDDAESRALKATLYEEQARTYRHCVLALLHFMKVFALDFKEIQAEHFRTDIDTFAEQVKSIEKPKRLELQFEQRKEGILDFIERQNSYIRDCEQELRDIIELLTRAMANLNVENLEFYQRVYDQSEKIIEITRLDDIKKIKNALRDEVERMRETVDLKKDQERRHMQRLAGQVTSLRQELEQARARSLTDALTGAYNRQALDDYLAEQTERGEVMQNRFALLLLDLDNFKSVNDTHGHQIGDRALMAFVQKCRTCIRSDDFLARYGGEEFVIILPAADLRNGLKKARQICETVSAARYATGRDDKDEYLRITVSIGVCAYKKGDNPETLIARADKALYDAKQNGKNRAVAKKL